MGATAGYCSACGDDDRDAWLEGTGTTIESLDDRARAWLASQEEWVRDYLAFCFCPEGEARVPLVTLARSRALSSYHYKAERLGITWSSEKAVAAARSYGDTLLGRWMRDELGLDLSQENNPLLLVALKILCGQALLWREQQESGQ